jgi:hypothetical protein
VPHLNSPAATAANDLNAIYLASMRQRFKAEINRLTSGDMAELLGQRALSAELAFPLSYVHALCWLHENVQENYREAVLAAFSKGRQGFLMRMLLTASDAKSFIEAYVDHWLAYDGEAQQQHQQISRLLDHCSGDEEALKAFLLEQWNDLGLFQRGRAEIYHELALDERERYRDYASDDEAERLALIDALPDRGQPPQRFDKLGLIPSMACPQTCRHCMFIWRPIMKDTPDPATLYDMVNGLTRSVLFTGGDLTKQLDDFYRAIATMKNIRTFAILLNGDFAKTPEITEQVMSSMANAVRKRPGNWPDARIILQISFDEVHQEVLVDKNGQLKERIAVANIANIVELAPRFKREIQLALLHKQNALNFSMALFQKGVFARLVRELGARGHQVQVLSAQPSSRLKPNPAQGGQQGQLIRDASFVLDSDPDVPIMLTSSTVDAYGRGLSLDKNETINDREMLLQMLAGKRAEGEYFDTDLMFWFNGWVTLFSAVHMNMGDVYRDGLDTILRRLHLDPLTRALHDFDLRLLDFYREIRDDLDDRIAVATGPHQLFHAITERADMRLHMTRRLIEIGAA